MRFFILIISTVLLAGCASTSLNSSAELPIDKQVIFWSHENQATSFRVINVNGEKVPLKYLPKFTDAPGPKKITIDTYNVYSQRDTGRKAILRFNFSFDAKPGYSYNVKLLNGTATILLPDTKLCLLEEPHGAPGSSVNYTGEYRTPSLNATTVECSPAEINYLDGSATK